MSFRSRALNWAKNNKTYNGDSWSGYCQALAYQMCAFFDTAPNPAPTSAAQASRWAFKRQKGNVALDAPVGAFHYWTGKSGDLLKYGHVGLDLSGGGKEVLMASNHVTRLYGLALGTTDVWSYMKKTGAIYLGWSYFNGGAGHCVHPTKPRKR